MAGEQARLRAAVDELKRLTFALQFWKSGTSGASDDADNLVVPEEWLDVDIKQGISNTQVEDRRKRFGWNEITTEKENLFIKFLMFFTGPILYGKSLPREKCVSQVSSDFCARNASRPGPHRFFSSSARHCGDFGRRMA